MLRLARQTFILKKLEEEGSVRTMELAAEMDVTDETVRRDLEALESRGEALRIHGGAVKAERAKRELMLTERQLRNQDAKRAIAQEAVKRIRENDTIFIDASSTALTLVDYLPDFRITVVTNAHNVVSALADREGIDLICTGGIWEPRSRSYIGLPAEAAMKKYHVHRMFFSATGVNLERGISETNSRQAAFKERIIEHSEEVCLLADATKMGLTASFIFAQIQQLSTIVTESHADPEALVGLASAGVEVVQVSR